MFDITAVEYSGIDGTFMFVILGIAVISGIIASCTTNFIKIHITAILIAVALFISFLIIMIIVINSKEDLYDRNYESNISAIENTGVTVLDANSPSLRYAFYSPDSATEVTLKTEEGNLLTCKIVTDSEVKTFDVQCLDPNTTDALLILTRQPKLVESH